MLLGYSSEKVTYKMLEKLTPEEAEKAIALNLSIPLCLSCLLSCLFCQTAKSSLLKSR